MKPEDFESLKQTHPEAIEALNKITHRVSQADLTHIRSLLSAGDLDAFYAELGLRRPEAESLYSSIRSAVRSRSGLFPAQVSDFLPLERPLLLLRSLQDIDPGLRVVAEAVLEENDWRAYGHPSTKQTVPVMLQLEALAQAATIGSLSRPGSHATSALCARVTNARFREDVHPGDKLRIESNVTQTRGLFDWVEAKAYVDQEEAVSALLTFRVDGDSLGHDKVIHQPTSDPTINVSPRPLIGQQEGSILTPDELHDLLPTSRDFMMIDELVELEPGRRAVANLRLDEDDWFFAGHFPGRSMMPGMLQLEALAQTSIVALLSSKESEFDSAHCTGVPQASFKHIIEPGDNLSLEVDVVPGEDSRSPVTKVRAWVGQALAAEGRLAFRMS